MFSPEIIASEEFYRTCRRRTGNGHDVAAIVPIPFE